MRKILALCGAILILAIGSGIWLAFRSKHYGEPFKNVPRADLAEVLANPKTYLERDVRLEDVVYRQCPVTGCWFYFKGRDGRELKIELGDVLTTLPQKKGSRAVVEGRITPQGNDYIFSGYGVEFGGASGGVKGQTPAAVASHPMPDGYPVDYCIVGGEKLGAMGDPVSITHEGRTVKFCCNSCIAKFKKEPLKYLAILDQAAAGMAAPAAAH